MMHVIVFYALFAVIWLFALRRGGRDERICAWIMIVAAVLTRVAASSAVSRFHAPELGIFVADIAMMAALTILALRTDRFWPLWMAGFQGYSIVAHVARLLTPTVGPTMYAIGQGLMGYPMLLLLLAAAIRHPAQRMEANSTG